MVYSQIKKVNNSAILNSAIPFPRNTFYQDRNRYRADSLIKYLSRFFGSDTVVIGLTSKDISTTKGNIKDWGVMGLGYCPGNSCIASTFRLSKSNINEQFYKVAIHELGHTQGLPHCPNKTCYMRDAEGGNPLNKENEFCAKCKDFLIKKGFAFH